MSEILIRRGNQEDLSSQSIKDGELIFARNTQNLFMGISLGAKESVDDKRALIASNNSRVNLSSTMQEDIIWGDKWDGSVYTDDISQFEGLFTELHDVDNHFYYVLKHGKMYRYPKMIYHQRNDSILLYSDSQGIFFTLQQLMNGEAVEDWNYTRVGKWVGKVGELVQTDLSNCPYYHSYTNRMVFKGTRSYLKLATALYSNIWELEFEFGTL